MGETRHRTGELVQMGLAQEEAEERPRAKSEGRWERGWDEEVDPRAVVPAS